MVTWYWYEWDMVWVFHTMVPWYWYGPHIPHRNGYHGGTLKSKNSYLIGTLKWVTEVTLNS